MDYRVLRVHTAHDDLEFKTREPKALFDNVVAYLERLRNEPTGGSVAPTADSVTDQIRNSETSGTPTPDKRRVQREKGRASCEAMRRTRTLAAMSALGH